MNKSDLVEWEKVFSRRMKLGVEGGVSLFSVKQNGQEEDPAHDFLHLVRVVGLARQLCAKEGGSLEIVLPAAWFHDFVVIPKNSPLRNQASRMSAEAAIEYLASVGYPEKYHDAIGEAILCHSFSAAIEPVSVEAKIVQDADRLDGLGAIGIARCFATAGLLKRAFYSSEDPFCEQREPDDQAFTVDHFYKKLFHTAEMLKTEAGRAEGLRRAEFMQSFLASLREDIFKGGPAKGVRGKSS